MQLKKTIGMIGLAVLSGVGANVFAAEMTNQDLVNEMKALKAEVAQLRAQQGDTWMNERRAEEVKALVREVLSDSETRASLLDSGLTAGYKKHFFLASADGNFLLNISGQIDTRYIWNSLEDGMDEAGFQLRRAKLGFDGHIIDPKLTYKIKAGFDRGDGAFYLEEAYAKYKFADHYSVTAGQFKGFFLHEETVSSSKQQAVERSAVNENFTTDYEQGVRLDGSYDMFRFGVSFHDGREQDNTDYNADNTSWAATARGEVLLAGNWKQFDDFQAWSGEEMGLMVGAGIFYADVNTGTGADKVDKVLQYTVDASFELSPLNLYAAFIGQNAEFDSAVQDDANRYGIIVQGGVFIIPDKLDIFARWERLELDGYDEIGNDGDEAFDPAANKGINFYTVGGNWYFKKHAAKLTVDMVYAPDGVFRSESGLGLTTSSEDQDQMVLRTQFQLLF